jgi:Mn2+/Fe2+ NRAMP family transporter
MGFSSIIAFFIILTSAVTLHTQGKTDIQTASEAAEALRPIAGNLAFFLFSIGIIGTGLLAVPVLAGSAAYGLGEALKWPTGLERKPLEAKGFYAILAISTLIGLAMNFFTSIDPVKALFWSAVINGVVAPPVMLVMMLMSTNIKVMGKFTISKYLQIGGWLATLVMFVAAAGLFLTWKS